MANRRGASVPSAPESIFVLRSNDLGDVLIVTPLFEALKRRFPSSQIILGTGPWATPLIEGNPHVSEVVPIEAPWGNKYAHRQGAWRAFCYSWASAPTRRLRRRSIDIGIDVTGSLWGSLFLLRSGIHWRLGTFGYAGGERGFHEGVLFDPCEHVGRHALRFAELMGARELPRNRPQIFLSQAEAEAGVRSWNEVRAANREMPIRVAIAPGAGIREKSWPVERFRDLVERISAQGRAQVIVLGGPTDEGIARAVSGERAASLAGSQSIRQMFATTAAADVVICNSSVILHAAAAFERPTVVVLGPAFRSSKQHQRQWGYEGLSETLGPEFPGDADLATVDDVLAAFRRLVGIDRAH